MESSAFNYKKIIRSKILLIIYLLPLAVISIFILQRGKWDRYYRKKMYQPAHEIIQKAHSNFTHPGTAIDLGCGVGNDAAFLLKNGWQVWAIDSQIKAIQMLKKRKDIPFFDKLTPVIAKFADSLQKESVPSVDFVYASYALPFCHPHEFKQIWNRLNDKILPDGRFAGHFFGYHYQGFSEKEKAEMTFLTKEEIYDLFKGFAIEYFREYEEDGKSGTGQPIHSHIFEIIAQKKADPLK